MHSHYSSITDARTTYSRYWKWHVLHACSTCQSYGLVAMLENKQLNCMYEAFLYRFDDCLQRQMRAPGREGCRRIMTWRVWRKKTTVFRQHILRRGKSLTYASSTSAHSIINLPQGSLLCKTDVYKANLIGGSKYSLSSFRRRATLQGNLCLQYGLLFCKVLTGLLRSSLHLTSSSSITSDHDSRVSEMNSNLKRSLSTSIQSLKLDVSKL